jgi:SAM-dependent methyltransferase
LSLRPDVAQAFPAISHAGLSGFDVSAKNRNDLGEIVKITVVGSHNGDEKTAFHSCHSRSDFTSSVPPGRLMQRVSGIDNPSAFRQIGLYAAFDLMTAVANHRGVDSVRTLLDWGCGCGRVSSEIMRLFPQIELTGCDIDAEAIAWCSAQTDKAVFRVTGIHPPLPFAESSFDAVVACSVMTHLDRQEQTVWLREIHRILRPGGLFLASVVGEFAASFVPGLRERLLQTPFIDDTIDHALDGVAPDGYYRATSQAQSFTIGTWSENFRVLEYIEAGLAGYQDLVVLLRA